MALKNTLIIGALLISFALQGVVDGQVDTPSPRFRHKAVESPKSTRPYATPGVFDYDTQVFAPLEFTNGKEKAPNTGFYFALDKLYTSVNLPPRNGNNGDTVKTGSTYIWGTGYEMGWFSDDDDGWGISYQGSEGINFTAGQDVSVSNPMLVTMGVSTVEVNRMFRQQLSGGGYFEPYIGMRYFNITDKTLEDTAQVLGGARAGNRFKQEATNNGVGLQVGGQYIVHRGRWRTNCNGAIATTYNQQRYFATDITNLGTAQGISESYSSDQSFVPILDGQFTVGYNISRDISLSTGLLAIYSWDGIGRANTLTTNFNPNSVFGAGGPTGISEDSHLSAGFIFGVEWRR